MTEIKVAASLTASLLAPKGEARPAGWRAIAARTTEPRPWYASLGRDRSDAAGEDVDGGSVEDPLRPGSPGLRSVPLIAIGDDPAIADDDGKVADGAASGDDAPPNQTRAPAAASLARIGGDRVPGSVAPPALANLNLAADSRIRITARLERNLHRRLKLASAHLGTSSQDLIADALSHYLDGVAAGPMRGHCACLTKSGSGASCDGCTFEESTP